MQTIESIRRTNELSKVLKQHGFAEDSFDAMNKAKSTLDEEPANASTVYGASATPHKHQENLSSERVDAKLATLERSKHLLASRVDSLQQELRVTQEHLQQALARLERAESKIRQVSTQTVSQNTSQNSSQNVQEQQTPAQSAPLQAPVARAEKKVDPSISIENIFNYSGK